jgi:hypothetical protein
VALLLFSRSTALYPVSLPAPRFFLTIHRFITICNLFQEASSYFSDAQFIIVPPCFEVAEPWQNLSPQIGCATPPPHFLILSWSTFPLSEGPVSRSLQSPVCGAVVRSSCNKSFSVVALSQREVPRSVSHPLFIDSRGGKVVKRGQFSDRRGNLWNATEINSSNIENSFTEVSVSLTDGNRSWLRCCLCLPVPGLAHTLPCKCPSVIRASWCSWH